MRALIGTVSKARSDRRESRFAARPFLVACNAGPFNLTSDGARLRDRDRGTTHSCSGSEVESIRGLGHSDRLSKRGISRNISRRAVCKSLTGASGPHNEAEGMFPAVHWTA